MDFVLKFFLEHQIAETQCQEFLIFSKYHSNLRDQMKNFDYFFLALYYNDIWMAPKLIESVSNKLIDCD